MAWSMHIDAKSLCMRKHTKVHPVQAMAWSMYTGAKSLCMRKHTKCVYSTSQSDGMEHAYRCKVVMHAEAHMVHI